MGLKSVNDVARMFNYERSTIIRYICNGKLEAIGGGAKGKPYYISDNIKTSRQNRHLDRMGIYFKYRPHDL